MIYEPWDRNQSVLEIRKLVKTLNRWEILQKRHYIDFIGSMIR